VVLFSHERLDAILAPRVPAWFPLATAADRVNRRLARLADVVVCASASATVEFERIGACEVRRVPLGVDLEVFAPPARSRAGCWSRSAGCPRRSGWTAGRATYVGLNIVGSDNNFPVFDSAGRQIDGDAAEALPRDAANQQWLRDTFTLARQRRSVAVLVVIQADMDWYGQFKAAGNPTDGFDATKKTLLQQTIAFPGQVALPPSSWTSR